MTGSMIVTHWLSQSSVLYTHAIKPSVYTQQHQAMVVATHSHV